MFYKKDRSNASCSLDEKEASYQVSQKRQGWILFLPFKWADTVRVYQTSGEKNKETLMERMS